MTRSIFVSLILLGTATAANAQCYGPPNFLMCEDAYGNRFEISQIGNQTLVYGYDRFTGQNWRQESYLLGDTMLSQGTTPTGERWNSQTGPNGDFHSDEWGTIVSAPE